MRIKKVFATSFLSNVPHHLHVILLLASLFLLANATFLNHASIVSAEEPQPFRRDVVDGRDFEYNDQSFIHRFSYRYRPGWQRQWDYEQQGFIITAGSTRSDELYITNQLLKDIPFNERFFGSIRYQRNEDFDSRYDRLLTGMGINLSDQWSAGLVATILERKENIDQQWELRWDNQEGDRFRFALVLANLLYNEKVDDDSEYTKRPITYFMDGRIQGEGEKSLYTWINWTPNAQIEFPEQSKQFDYDQIEGGIRTWLPLSETWGLQTGLEGQTGNRNTRALSPQFKDAQNLDRKHFSVLAELSNKFTPATEIFAGMRYFFLSENYDKISNPSESGELKRREPMPYTGVVFNVTDNFIIWPTLYTSILNNKNYDPKKPEERSESKRVLGKLTIPLEYRFSERASATFNTSFQNTSRGPFGGWNVQFLVYF